MSVNNCIILMCVHLNIIVPNLIILVHLSIQLCTTQLIASLFHSHIIVALSLSLSLCLKQILCKKALTKVVDYAPNKKQQINRSVKSVTTKKENIFLFLENNNFLNLNNSHFLSVTFTRKYTNSFFLSLSLTHFSILSFVKASCGGTYTHIHTHRFLKHIPFPTFKFYSMLSISKKILQKISTSITF